LPGQFIAHLKPRPIARNAVSKHHLLKFLFTGNVNSSLETLSRDILKILRGTLMLHGAQFKNRWAFSVTLRILT